MPERFQTVIRPVVTEKASEAYRTLKEYTFQVHNHATKQDIRAAIEELFDVRVVHVRTMVQRAKRRTLGRSVGRRPRWKKAFVRLAEGDRIEIFEE